MVSWTVDGAMGFLRSGWLSCRRNRIAAASEPMPDFGRALNVGE